jgi:hypothetical protein
LAGGCRMFFDAPRFWPVILQTNGNAFDVFHCSRMTIYIHIYMYIIYICIYIYTVFMYMDIYIYIIIQ